MEIAMHEGLGLRQRGVDQCAVGVLDDVPLLAARRETEVLAEEPTRHQLQLVHQPLLVILRQVVAGDLALHMQDRVHGLCVPGIDVTGIQRRQQRLRAKVAHQHVAMLGIVGADGRRVQAGVG